MDSRQNQELLLKVGCVLSSLKKKLKTVVVVVLMCGIGLDVFQTVTYKPLYVSQATVILKLEKNTYSQLENALAYFKTMDYILNSRVAKEYVKRKSNVKELDMNCSISSIDNTNYARIQVTSNTKRISYYTLNYLIEWYQKNTNKYNFSYQLNVLEQGSLNEIPINTNSHLQNFKNGSLISGVIVIALFVLQAYLKDTIKSPKEIEERIDSRLFAKIPKEKKPGSKKFWKKNKRGILVTSFMTSFFYKESMKKLRSKVEASAKKHDYKTIMVTSSLENEGKSSIAVNLALSLAQNNHKVLLIDADIRKPSVHKIFDLKTDKSLNQYLNGEKTWESQIEYHQKNELFMLCSNQDLDHAEEYLQSDRMKALISNARKQFDFVIIDTSPAYYINEPLIINEMVDASFIVVKQNEATSKIINETIFKLVNAKNNLIGCIYNASIIDIAKRQKTYGYRYGYNRYQRERRA